MKRIIQNSYIIYSIIDIETTGGKFNEEAITEMAIYRFDGYQVVDRFVSLINTKKEIQPYVVKLTGINSQMLRYAPKFYEVANRILEITEDSILVAHNAQFDYRVLQLEFKRIGYRFSRESLCTIALAKKLIPKMPSYSLGKLTSQLGIPLSNRHRATGDAKATVELLKLLLDIDTEKKIVEQTICHKRL